MGIPTGYKPNLAATLTKPELIKYPVYCSPKIDGIRCVVFDGVAYSRSLKPIPNESVQAWAKANAAFLEALDGELIVGADTDPNAMQKAMAVMKKTGEPDFTFYAFDIVKPGIPYAVRLSFIDARFCRFSSEEEEARQRTVWVEQTFCYTAQQVDHWERRYLEYGYEGLMLRSPDALYKYGRSTEREGGLVKVKRFTDAEAEVVGYVEEMQNTNEAKKDALGNTERSTEKAGLVGKGTLGALVVQGIPHPHKFNIGTGFTAIERAYIWAHREELLGSLVTFKYFDHGIKESPRHPVFVSFRHADDL
jgi:DNA ligase-1